MKEQNLLRVKQRKTRKTKLNKMKFKDKMEKAGKICDIIEEERREKIFRQKAEKS